MDLYEAIRKRKSIRKYKDEPLPNAALERILDAGRLANSARNRQEWFFIAVTDSGTKRALVPACRDQEFVGECGAIIAVCATETEDRMRCDQPTSVVDCSIAADHMQLAATAEGFGTCWLGSFYQDQVKRILNIPEKADVVAVLTIGVPDEEGRPKSRKPLEDIVHREKWGNR